MVVNLNERIRELRRLTGLSQGKFAEKFGIPRSTLQNWEQGVRTPPPYVVTMLEKMIEASH